MASKEEVIALMARMKSIHPHYIIKKTKIDDRGMVYLI